MPLPCDQVEWRDTPDTSQDLNCEPLSKSQSELYVLAFSGIKKKCSCGSNFMNILVYDFFEDKALRWNMSKQIIF